MNPIFSRPIFLRCSAVLFAALLVSHAAGAQQGERRATDLFDLAADPAEQHPLPADDARATALSAMLAARVEAAARARSQPAAAAIDDDTKRRLRALGY